MASHVDLLFLKNNCGTFGFGAGYKAFKTRVYVKLTIEIHG
jgi:hypothetical protein